MGNVNSKYSDVNSNNWTLGIIDQIDANGCDGTFTQATRDSIRLDEPMPFVYTTTHSAAVAYQRVLDFAGASLHRDSFDELMVSDTRNNAATYTGKGLSKGFVNSQDDNKPSNADGDWSAWPVLNSSEAPVDTDGDGMPDVWEAARLIQQCCRWQPAQRWGYTNVEVYMNSLVADITEAQYVGGTPMGSVQYKGDEPAVTNYELSQQTSNGDWTFSNGFSIFHVEGLCSTAPTAASSIHVDRPTPSLSPMASR